MTKSVKIILICLVVLLFVFGFYYFFSLKKGNQEEASEQIVKVKLYYYNPNLDKDESGNILCSTKGLVPVEREIPLSNHLIKDTISLLLKGELTDIEKAQGITTEYPLEGFALKEAFLEDGLLTLSFVDPNNKTIGGSCRTSILWNQIQATAKQFPQVKEVIFLPETLFQP